jgi:hypothetical protein
VLIAQPEDDHAAKKDDAAQQRRRLAERRLRGIERDRIDFVKA